MPRFVKPLLILVPCVILALIVIIGCFDIVPAGYKGVKLTMGAVDNTVLNEGIHFKLPFAQRIVHVDARVKKYTVEGETSASKDMQSITTNVAVNYRVDGANVDELYKNLSLNYENTIIAPAVSECIKSVTSQYTAEETITRRSEISAQIKDMLKFDYNIQYDEKDSIGKRYRRQDAIGTPLCITVDYQSLEDKTVTVRHRDSMQQHRVAIADLAAMVGDEVSLRKLFSKIV